MPRKDNRFEVLFKLESTFILAILSFDSIANFLLRVRACIFYLFFILSR